MRSSLWSQPRLIGPWGRSVPLVTSICFAVLPHPNQPDKHRSSPTYTETTIRRPQEARRADRLAEAALLPGGDGRHDIDTKNRYVGLQVGRATVIKPSAMDSRPMIARAPIQRAGREPWVCIDIPDYEADGVSAVIFDGSAIQSYVGGDEHRCCTAVGLLSCLAVM